jgi:hypothetical protein
MKVPRPDDLPNDTKRTNMKMTIEHARMTRRISAGALVAVSAVALSGCVGMAPTYGTGKAADTQLMEDVTGMFSLSGSKKREQIDYKPRPELVKPADTKNAPLPAPQDNITTASAGGAWPESPEARLARVRADATAKRDDLGFEPEVDMPIEKNRRSISVDKQRKDFNERLAMSNQGSATERRYLSEPPLEYRQPAATAATDDVGEDEWKKEKRRKAGHTKKGSSWWPF